MAMMVGAPHWFSSDFDVREAERHLAHADLSAWREKGTLTAAVSLPEPWPLPLRIFVIWLTVILWRRERSM